MTFRQHIPAMVTIDAGPFTLEFTTAEELLANRWIADWKQHPGFHRFSVSAYLPGTSLLMAEFKNHPEARWWVLGYIEGGDAAALGLPAFNAAEAARAS